MWLSKLCAWTVLVINPSHKWSGLPVSAFIETAGARNGKVHELLSDSVTNKTYVFAIPTSSRPWWWLVFQVDNTRRYHKTIHRKIFYRPGAWSYRSNNLQGAKKTPQRIQEVSLKFSFIHSFILSHVLWSFNVNNWRMCLSQLDCSIFTPRTALTKCVMLMVTFSSFLTDMNAYRSWSSKQV